MQYLFCPEKIVWGDVATWVAGIGSLSAVATALWISVRDVRLRNKLFAREAHALALTMWDEVSEATSCLPRIRAALVAALNKLEAFTTEKDWREVERQYRLLNLPITRLALPRIHVLDSEIVTSVVRAVSCSMELERLLSEIGFGGHLSLHMANRQSKDLLQNALKFQLYLNELYALLWAKLRPGQPLMRWKGTEFTDTEDRIFKRAREIMEEGRLS